MKMSCEEEDISFYDTNKKFSKWLLAFAMVDVNI